MLTSPMLVELAARVAISMFRLDESACWERLWANAFVALESYELPEAEPPIEKKPRSIPSPPPPPTAELWNVEVEPACSLTLTFETAFAIPAMNIDSSDVVCCRYERSVSLSKLKREWRSLVKSRTDSPGSNVVL